MPTPSQRPSLNTDLESRYNNQTVGSAFDAKRFDTGDFGIQEKLWTRPGFVPNEELGLGGKKTYDKSTFLKGFSSKKYKG